MTHRNALSTALVGFALAVCLAVPVHADPGEAGFLVTALPPHNQEDKQASHFDLLTVPGEIQRLELQVENTGDQPITVTVETIAASTNRNGRIHYSSPGLLDETMAHPFPALAVPETAVLEIPAHSEETAAVILTMPEEPISGTVLGAIRVVRQPDEKDNADGTGIVNQYSYAIGVRLRDTGTHREAEERKPSFALGTVHADSVNHKAAIVAEIRNTEPVIAKELSFHARIFQVDRQDTPLIEKEQGEVEMAPNSIFPLSLVDQEGYGFPEGDYIALVSLEYGGEVQEFRQEFVIEPVEAQAVNGAAVNQTQNQTPPVQAEAGSDNTVQIVLAGGILLILAALALAIWKRCRV